MRPEEAQSEADLRMAELLQEDETSRMRKRRTLQSERTDVAEDLLGRLNALDFVSSVVGEATDIPDRLGDYRITGLLGRGGMGTVYQAFQESLEREVALKVLSPAYSADPTMRERFRSEARATASLHHQHIVPIYDYGEASGFLYFAMEKVDGVSLDKHIAAARHRGAPFMEPRKAAARFAGVADALGHAHKRRLLHRDVKPGNILVQSDGTLALADFGLSKVLGEASVRLTSKGSGFLGTLHYAAPEQALSRDLTPAGDLYSLGVTMFEAITNTLPISGRSTEAVLQSILHGRRARLRECLPKAPRDLEAVLAKLLSAEPEDRYRDGEVLARDLLRVAEGEPVRIRRQPLPVRVWRRARKNPGLSAAVITAAILLLVTFALLQGMRNVETRSLASRHGDLLARAMTEVQAELGSPSGPPGLLTGLTGMDPEPEPWRSAVLGLLDEARQTLPDDPQAGLMERAYLDDPHQSATALLREGRGFEALRELDREIEGLAGERDASSELRLYRLYLGRAVANLTPAVSRIDAARMDLVRATLLRPAAFFSNALMAITEWDPASGSGSLQSRLDALLDNAPSGGREVVGSLLLALADIRPHSAANLMSFEILYGDRRVLHRRAVDLLGGVPEGAVLPGTPTGLEAVLADHARLALRSLGDRFSLDRATRAGWDLLNRSLAPESRLHAWGVVLSFLLDQNDRNPIRLPNGELMSAELQVEGWLALLGLQPSEPLLRLAGERVAELRQLGGVVPGMSRLQAELARQLGTPDEAFAAAQTWVQEHPDDPDALLCRLQARLRAGDLVWVRSDGSWALNVAADADVVLGRILGMLEQAEELYSDSPDRVEQLRAMARAFRGETS